MSGTEDYHPPDSETPRSPSATSRSTAQAAVHVSKMRMTIEIMAFFLPLFCFPILDIAFRAIWEGRPSEELPFPPVLLSFITGGASMLITCGVMVSTEFTMDPTYLYFSCGNMTYIILFLCGNVTSLTNRSAMVNVSPDGWRINIYYFFTLFTILQLAFNSTLRHYGASEEDLGAFGQVTPTHATQIIWNFVSNLRVIVRSSSGCNAPLAGNPVVMEHPTLSPPPYFNCNIEDRNTLLIADE